MKAPIPENEIFRLATLHTLNILDTPAEDRFDRITRTAVRLFKVPIALISFVDEQRQWFKSRVGCNLSEISRDLSLCAHTLMDNDALVVENALKDPRVVHNPFVTEAPFLRFYAGFPLTVDGMRIGTLCIFDRKARAFRDKDRASLRDLAMWASRELTQTVHHKTILPPGRAHSDSAAFQSSTACSSPTDFMDINLQGRAKILHVEDDEDIQRLVKLLLGKQMDIVHAPDLREARQVLDQHHFDLALLDLSLPDGSGLELMPALKQCLPPVPVVIFSIHDIAPELATHVEAALSKTQTSNADFLNKVQTILEMLQRQDS